eukprot:gene3909-4272_t
MTDGILLNRLHESPGFTLAIGGLLTIIGYASKTKKIDSLMTSSLKSYSMVWLWLVTFAIWDRARPPLISISIMYCLALLSTITIFIFPELHTYINGLIVFGMISVCSLLEVSSLGFGPVASEQILLTYLALLLGGIGVLWQVIRTENLLRHSIIIGLCCCLWTFLCGYWFYDDLSVSLVTTVLITCLSYFPTVTTSLSPWMSTIAIIVWWYALRCRPGDPILHYFDNYEIFAVPLLVIFKLNIRRLLAYQVSENIPKSIYLENFAILLEKTLMVFWTGYLLFVEPHNLENFFYQTILCYYPPAFPNFSYHIYYMIIMASAIEDCIWWIVSGGSTPRLFTTGRSLEYRNGKNRDVLDSKLIGIFHFLSAIFLIGTYYSEQVKLGMIFMFFNHISDCVHFIWKLTHDMFSIPSYSMILLVVNILFWIYFRVWLMISLVLYSLITESKSFIHNSECVPGDCSWREAPERTPLTILLVNMLLLYLLGLVVLIFKIFAKPIVNGPKEDSVSAKNYGLSSSLKVNNSSGRTSLRQRSSTPPHQREALDTMV